MLQKGQILRNEHVSSLKPVIHGPYDKICKFLVHFKASLEVISYNQAVYRPKFHVYNVYIGLKQRK
jgi:hypothetical protein